MIELGMEQGSPEWFAARLGIPTSSQFHRIITPKTLKPSSQAGAYASELLAEWITGEPCDDSYSVWIGRGIAMEADARAFYEMEREVDVRLAGFCLADARTMGCSPDGLVGDDGGVEIKVPKASVHAGYLLDGTIPDKYKPQVYGSLLVTGREWWDFLSFNPAMPSLLVRAHRTDDYMEPLAAALAKFADLLAERRAVLSERGGVPDADAAGARLDWIAALDQSVSEDEFREHLDSIAGDGRLSDSDRASLREIARAKWRREGWTK